MALWGKTDALESAPKYLSVEDVEKAYFGDTHRVVETRAKLQQHNN